MTRPRLLVYRALGLGDLLTAVPGFVALAEAFPSHRRTLATTAGVAPLARHLGLFDEVVETTPFEPLPAADPADVAVNLHGRGPQSHAVVLAGQPRRLLAFEHPEVPVSRGGPEWRAGEHEVARWCRLLSESGVPVDPARLAIEPPRRRLPAFVRGATVIHPGAASPARRWPAERWAEVARAERAAGRAVVVTGGAGEVGLARAVAARAGLRDEAVLAGRTDVLALAALVAQAGRVACGDTGVAHLATALGTPSVVLFGPTSPALWGPPPGRGRHVALWAGRTGDPHGDEVDRGLLALTPAEVVGALATVAGGPAPVRKEAS